MTEKPYPAEGQSVTATFRIPMADQTAFADLSGDTNPLHLDDTFARSRGYSGCVVYGGLILAQLSRVIGMEIPGRGGLWNSVKMDFRSPLLVDEEARIDVVVSQLSEATRVVVLKVRVMAGDRTIATGETLATLTAIGVDGGTQD